MNKRMYLKSLKEYLKGKISSQELGDILSDYEGFFLTGMEEGRNEEDMSKELGNPIEIAKSLIQAESSESSMVFAPVYKRIPALIIDIIISALPFIWFAPPTALGLYFRPQVVANMLPSIFSTIKVSSHPWISDLRTFWYIAVAASVFWFLLINPLCMCLFKGYTLGKKIMKIRVVSVDGANASLMQILVREWVGKYIINFLSSLLPSVLVLLPSLSSLIWASVSKRHKTIHDAIARTCVVNCQSIRSEKR